MPRGRPIQVGTRVFTTQGEATAFFRAMLQRYTVGQRVNDEDAADLGLLLERHPEYRVKVGCGVDHFEAMTTEHGTPCFRVVRVDGSGTDFSYLSSIRGAPPARKSEVLAAFRYAIREDLWRARDAFFAEHADKAGTVACAVTGERIRREDAHLDHRPPMTFEVIVTTFLAAHSMTVDDVPLSDGEDDQTAPTITNSTLLEEFKEYHRRVARLDYVKAAVHRVDAPRHRLRTGRVRVR